MTQKRFVNIGVEWVDGFIQDHIGDRDLFNVGAVCNLLNELSEENKQLKQESYGNLDGLETYKSLYHDLSEKYDNLEADYDDLKKENEQLKSELRTLRNFRGFITEKNVFNEKERKELQLQMLRLYNYFKDYFEDTMSPEIFSKMWDTVKKSEKWENGEFLK